MTVENWEKGQPDNSLWALCLKDSSFLRDSTSYTIQPGDALVAQTRDARGRFIPWITNW